VSTFPDDAGPAHALHALVSRLDRSADRILRAEFDLTYPRFLTLITLRRIAPATQSELATAMGLSEPAVSRMVAGLRAAGLVDVGIVRGAGNRRQLSLTPSGRAAIGKAADRLEEAFRSLAHAAGVGPEDVTALTGRLLAAFDRRPS
jgi:DNA-binding MarR family transcriptional regulator